ncbi:DNA/RNA non-specific endonuclease [Enterococcus sp. LJL99]
MAKKKKKSNVNSTTILIVSLVVLMLSALGIQVPEIFDTLFGSSTEQTTTKKKTSSSYQNPGPSELGPATFSAEELKDSPKGWITYHSLDNLDRATGADALLKPEMVGTGTAANRDIRPAGFISGDANHARGHLIGRQMGGSGDDPRNLTTLYQNPVNTPFMTKYENQIRKALDQGETIRYRVTPIYEGNELLCKEIKLEAKGLNADTTVDFDVNILNEE